MNSDETEVPLALNTLCADEAQFMTKIIEGGRSLLVRIPMPIAKNILNVKKGDLVSLDVKVLRRFGGADIGQGKAPSEPQEASEEPAAEPPSEPAEPSAEGGQNYLV